MKAKDMLMGDDARTRLISGVDKLANAVKATMGPLGRNVVIGAGYRHPHVTKDGVSVARQVVLKDQFENLGAQMVRDASLKAAESAGDGTTTATVLAQAFVHAGLELMSNGLSPVVVKRKMDELLPEVIEQILDVSTKVESKSDILKVALVSSNGDEVISENVADAFYQVGKENGVVNLEDSRDEKDRLEYSPGVTYSKGYVNAYFCTNPDTRTVSYSESWLLLVNDTLEVSEHLPALADEAVRTNTPVVIVANEFTEEVINLFIRLKVHAGLKVALMEAPGFGERRDDDYDDLALLSGAVVVGKSQSAGIEDWKTSLGLIGGVGMDRFQTVIVPEDKAQYAMEQRLAVLQEQLAQTPNEYLRSRFQERIARLGGGVATIYVGGTTKIEQKERKDRYDDALRAVRVASIDGYVPGGGWTLFHILQRALTKDLAGSDALYHALAAPVNTIRTNAGLDALPIKIDPVLADSTQLGFDVREGIWVNLIDQGIIDPTTVTITALKAAISVAGLILTTECALVDTDNLLDIGTPETE